MTGAGSHPAVRRQWADVERTLRYLRRPLADWCIELDYNLVTSRYCYVEIAIDHDGVEPLWRGCWFREASADDGTEPNARAGRRRSWGPLPIHQEELPASWRGGLAAEVQLEVDAVINEARQRALCGPPTPGSNRMDDRQLSGLVDERQAIIDAVLDRLSVGCFVADLMDVVNMLKSRGVEARPVARWIQAQGPLDDLRFAFPSLTRWHLIEPSRAGMANARRLTTEALLELVAAGVPVP